MRGEKPLYISVMLFYYFILLVYRDRVESMWYIMQISCLYRLNYESENLQNSVDHSQESGCWMLRIFAVQFSTIFWTEN
jgi:hypothetical protein